MEEFKLMPMESSGGNSLEVEDATSNLGLSRRQKDPLERATQGNLP